MATLTPILETLRLPLARDESGVLRVSGTRITLDVVVELHRQGLSAEAIAAKLPSLPLSDVYAVVAFCLANPEFVERELQIRDQHAEEWRAKLAPFAPSDDKIKAVLAK